MITNNVFSLMIHGGAGLITNPQEYEVVLNDILVQGQGMLQDGLSALDVVEQCVQLMEDSPIFNAGKGSVLNENGKVELDASIMNGSDMSAGAVAAASNIKNPISLARQVLERSEHVLLIGTGAMEFAKSIDICTEDDDYFVTEARIKQWEAARENGSITLDHSSVKVPEENKLGTVGAVALDVYGNIAAATSTGGLVNKKFGRVGDSPIVGAGVFADNETCGVSCTGIGEHILRTNLAKSVSSFMSVNDVSLKDASKKAIEYFSERIGGLGGFIAIGRDGSIACEFTTPQMIYGFVTNDQSPKVQFDKMNDEC